MGGGGIGGVKIKIDDQLSPAEAEVGAELGNIDFSGLNLAYYYILVFLLNEMHLLAKNQICMNNVSASSIGICSLINTKRTKTIMIGFGVLTNKSNVFEK